MTTWNPSDKSALITLSGGNLIATSSAGAVQGVRGTTSQSSGKIYWEMVATTRVSGTVRAGFENSSFSLAANLGTTTNSVGVNYSDSLAALNNVSLGATAASGYANGDVMRMALDIGGLLFWGAKNNGNWNNSGSADPATGAGGYSISGIGAGPYFLGFSSSSVTGNVCTMIPGGTTYGAPSGFTAWDPPSGVIAPFPPYLNQSVKRAAYF